MVINHLKGLREEYKIEKLKDIQKDNIRSMQKYMKHICWKISDLSLNTEQECLTTELIWE